MMIYELIKGRLADRLSPDNFHPFPRYEERAKWAALPEATRKFYLEQGAALKNKQWESLPASLYMDFTRTGDRSQYERLFFGRRSDLFLLLMAECIEGQKQYVDDIINGIWLICEETTWAVPAHIAMDGINKSELVPNIEGGVVIDLFAAETASLLSWVYYIVGDLIAETAPLVKRRIAFEMERRIIRPYMTCDAFWWLGFNPDRHVNNWNPWINSNVLTALLLFIDDPAEKVKALERAARSIDRFIDSYNEDGGCDEGPGYFGVAGASLLDFLEALNIAADGIVDVFGQAKIKNIASYIYKVYIGGRYYVNFADAAAKHSPPASLLYRAGVRSNDARLMGFANHLRQNNRVLSAKDKRCWTLFRHLSDIFQTDWVEHAFSAPRVSWFGSIQVLTARDYEGRLDGLFIAAKGGHNAESHNHNDIGNFVLYYNSEPVIVDAGVGTYTKETFSDKRYTIWTMQSCYHNTPTINGFTQQPGLEHCAESVTTAFGDIETALTMDIKAAYPSEAAILRYERSFRFIHGGDFTVTDRYALSACKEPLQWHMLAYNEPVIDGDSIRLSPHISLRFDAARFDVATEPVPLTDATLQMNWNKPCLYRLTLTDRQPASEGETGLLFTRA